MSELGEIRDDMRAMRNDTKNIGENVAKIGQQIESHISGNGGVNPHHAPSSCEGLRTISKRMWGMLIIFVAGLLGLVGNLAGVW